MIQIPKNSAPFFTFSPDVQADYSFSGVPKKLDDTAKFSAEPDQKIAPTVSTTLFSQAQEFLSSDKATAALIAASFLGGPLTAGLAFTLASSQVLSKAVADLYSDWATTSAEEKAFSIGMTLAGFGFNFVGGLAGQAIRTGLKGVMVGMAEGEFSILLSGLLSNKALRETVYTTLPRLFESYTNNFINGVGNLWMGDKSALNDVNLLTIDGWAHTARSAIWMASGAGINHKADSLFNINPTNYMGRGAAWLLGTIGSSTFDYYLEKTNQYLGLEKQSSKPDEGILNHLAKAVPQMLWMHAGNMVMGKAGLPGSNMSMHELEQQYDQRIVSSQAVLQFKRDIQLPMNECFALGAAAAGELTPKQPLANRQILIENIVTKINRDHPQIILLVAPDLFGKSRTLEDLNTALVNAGKTVTLDATPTIENLLKQPPQKGHVVMIDEVTPWLDKASREEVQQLLTQVKNAGGSLVLALHHVHDDAVEKLVSSDPPTVHYIPPLTVGDIIPLMKISADRVNTDWGIQPPSELFPEIAARVHELSGGYGQLTYRLAMSVFNIPPTYSQRPPLVEVQDYRQWYNKFLSNDVRPHICGTVQAVVEKVQERLSAPEQTLWKQIATTDGMVLNPNELIVAEPLIHWGLLRIDSKTGVATIPSELIKDCLATHGKYGAGVYVTDVHVRQAINTCIRIGENLAIYSVPAQQMLQVQQAINDLAQQNNKKFFVIEGEHPTNLSEIVEHLKSYANHHNVDTTHASTNLRTFTAFLSNLSKKIHHNKLSYQDQPPVDFVLVYSNQPPACHNHTYLAFDFMSMIRAARWPKLPLFIVTQLSSQEVVQTIGDEGSNWVGTTGASVNWTNTFIDNEDEFD